MNIKITDHTGGFPGTDKPFVVSDHFVERSNPRIHNVGENVKKFFYDMVVPPLGQCIVSGHILGENVSGNGSVKDFRTRGGICFVVAWHFLLQQPQGEDGFLLTNGMTTIFPEDEFSIGLFWFKKKGWSIRAYPLGQDYSRIWFKDNKVVEIIPRVTL